MSTTDNANLVMAERGKIITNFAYLEGCISIFISVHYSGNNYELMINEMLEDPLFSFELKKKICKKIAKESYLNTYKQIPWEKLNRMQTIRNIVAHKVLARYSDTDITGIEEIYFKYNGKTEDANKLMGEYETLRLEVQPAIKGLPHVIIE